MIQETTSNGRQQALHYGGAKRGLNMSYLGRAMIFTVVVFAAMWILHRTYSLSGDGMPVFAFLSISSLIGGAFLHFVYIQRRRPESHSDLVDNIPGLGWISDSRGRIIGMGSRMRQFLNVPKGSFTVAASSIHPEDRQKTLDLWGPYQRSVQVSTHRLMGPDGHYHWFRSAVHPIRDQYGVIISSWGTFIDISDLKAAEEALGTSENNLRLILDNIPGQIVTADANGVNDYCNQISELFYGHTFHEINGMGFTRFVHADDIDEMVADGLHRIANAIPIDQSVRLLRHDGVYRWFRIRVNPAFDENGNVVRWYGLHTDIDDEVRALEALRDAQDKLAQASEYASLAELAASIAHEVNQPLSAIVTHSEACRLWLAASPPNLERARTSADRIVRDATGAANIVSRMRELFAKKVPHKGEININETIDDVVHLIQKKYANRGLTVGKELDASIPLLVADRIQIQQVIFNILRNGVEAMQSDAEQPLTLNIKSRFDGGVAVVEVEDNGSGLADPNKAFEPFYTTKIDGMGMGLSICRSIIDAHMGRLWAKARPTRGTVFAFELPIRDISSPQDHDDETLYKPIPESV